MIKEKRKYVFAVIGATLLVSGCSGGTSRAAAKASAVPAALSQRVEALQAAVAAWADSRDLAGAKAAAEKASNLVTGPEVTGYGDLDGDGVVGGKSAIGLLPGEHGEAGLASGVKSSCLDRDVLGGSWDDPAKRWAQMRDLISQWSATNNTFPKLRSHPQRVVGWAQLTLKSKSLEKAHEFADHAKLHVTVIENAVASC